MKCSLPILPFLPLPPLSPFPVCLRKQTNKKFRWNLSPRAWQRDPGCSSSSAVCFLQLHLSLHLSRPLLTPASVLSAGRVFQSWLKAARSPLPQPAQAWNWLESLSPVCSVPFQPPESQRRRSLQGATQRCVLASHKLTWSLNVHSWITSLSILWSSVNFDGIFPQFQKLEKLVFRPLLQGHQGPGFLLQILIYGQNDLGSLLRFLVPRVFEEPLQWFLVDVFKDVAHSFLAWGCVEVVAVDGRADSQRGGHGAGLVAWLCFHRWEDLRELRAQALQRVCSKLIPALLFKAWRKAPGSNYTGDIRVISGKNNHRQV